MPFIDTHCHLIDRYVPADAVEDIIRRAAAVNVGALVAACAAPDDPEKVLALCGRHENLFCTIGIHPEYAGKATPNYEHLLSRPHVVGVGEIGLDYHYSPDSKAQQIELFEKQLDIARRHNLPVAIHSRNAEEDTAVILTGTVPGVMHCYTGSWDLAKKMLDRGFYFSAGGIITFKNANEVRETFAKIPTDRIVIETDSPWLAPVPYRGKPCEPFMVVETAKVLADIHKMPLPDMERMLHKNTQHLYPKIVP